MDNLFDRIGRVVEIDLQDAPLTVLATEIKKATG
jgi:hypothetical protein